jgi:hypothetical protein
MRLRLVAAAAMFASSAVAQQPLPECPKEIAMEATDMAIMKEEARLGAEAMPILETMENIVENAPYQNIPLDQQLSKNDLHAFAQARQQVMKITLKRVIWSNYKRDVHAIMDVEAVAEAIDLRGDSPRKDDPRAFFAAILTMLGIIWPTNPNWKQSPQYPSPWGIKCDPEAGLSFQQSFFRDEFNKASDQATKRRYVDAYWDMQRLRQLHYVAQFVLTTMLADADAAYWLSDDDSSLQLPDTIKPKILRLGDEITRTYGLLVMIGQTIPSEEEQFLRGPNGGRG